MNLNLSCLHSMKFFPKHEFSRLIESDIELSGDEIKGKQIFHWVCPEVMLPDERRSGDSSVRTLECLRDANTCRKWKPEFYTDTKVRESPFVAARPSCSWIFPSSLSRGLPHLVKEHSIIGSNRKDWKLPWCSHCLWHQPRSLQYSFLIMCLWKQQLIVQISELLHPHGRSWMEFWIPCFGLVPALVIVAIGGINQDMEDISVAYTF